MSIRTIWHCDKCAKEAEINEARSWETPKDWLKLELRYNSSSYGNKILCPDCKATLKVGPIKIETVANVGDQLIEILSEIAQEATRQ